MRMRSKCGYKCDCTDCCSRRKPQRLEPGQIVFVEANGEGAAPGWYKILRFDHNQTRDCIDTEGKDRYSWWWLGQRLDGLEQTIEETSAYLVTNCEGAPPTTAWARVVGR
jgi:hypothetical protein